MVNDLSYGKKKSGQIFLPFVTMHAFDRRTDRQTPFSRLDRPAFNAAR